MKIDARAVDRAMRALDALEGVVCNIDKETDMKYHDALYGALDALEYNVEEMTRLLEGEIA